MTRPLTCTAIVLMTVAAAACAGGGDTGSSSGAEPAAGACTPTDATLAEGATLANMAGSYHLVVVAPDSSTATGRLNLTERIGQRSVGQTSFSLQGTAEIDFAAVGAAAPPSMDSEDPERPGVLVLESDEEEGRRILVRFGMFANDLVRPSFDGSFTLLEPREIGADGFRGTWRSGGAAPSRSGHFCAWAG